MTRKEKILYKERVKHGLAEMIVPCNEEENKIYNEMQMKNQKLPDHIVFSAEYSTFYKKEKLDFTQEEIKEILMHKQLELLTEIKSHTKFLYCLTIIGILFGVLGGIIALIAGLA